MCERRRTDRGASTIEYVALLLIVALIVAAATLVIPNPVGDEAKVALCKIFNAVSGGTGDCERKPFTYKPPTAACVTGQDSSKIGGSVTVFSVKVGENFQLLRITTADGRVKVMVVPVDYRLGVVGKEGLKFNVGGKDYGLHAGGNVEGAVGLKYGDTWSFANAKDADDFVGKMKLDWGRREAERLSPLVWGVDKITGWKPSTRDPDSRQWDVNVEGLASFGAKFGKFQTGENGEKSVTDIGTGVEVEGKIGDGVSIIKDDHNPTNPSDPSYPRTSVVFTVQGSVKGGGKALGYGPSGSVSYVGQTKVTRDKDGKLVSITWVTTHEESGSEGYKVPGKKKGSEKNSEKKVTTTTTTVGFDDSTRAIGDQWILDNAFLMPLQTVRNAFDPSGGYSTRDPGPGASPFDKLIYEQGVVTRNTYAGDVDEYGIGLEAGEGFTFGIDAGYEHDRTHLVASEYLEGPQNGQRNFVQWPECAGAS
ncbi:hypothetical protein [Actinomadura sp. DC4]|uniref:hypothetical protein n=1 Tax=Actinomadura sp. DC4 TaxID=3055069 RepID=UPI0025B02F65|nr:hypothetical protein [Actinomadura sp. DC4]MDN3356887.1 hypothetical protein [Actinomadura sp. DC4]